MCGRIVWRFDPVLQQLIKDWLEDAAAYDAAIQAPQVAQSRYNITPGSRVPVATVHAGEHRLEPAKWAFPLDGRYIFSTRIETAFGSAMWRGLIGRHHCALPVTGFYEWAPSKQPFFVQRRDGRPMLLAGVTGMRQHRGEATLCASVVTCAPNATMARLHDRMPVILEQDRLEDWLRPEHLGHDGILDLAVPAGDVLDVHPVSTRVNDGANEGPELLTPAPAQGTLPL